MCPSLHPSIPSSAIRSISFSLPSSLHPFLRHLLHLFLPPFIPPSLPPPFAPSLSPSLHPSILPPPFAPSLPLSPSFSLPSSYLSCSLSSVRRPFPLPPGLCPSNPSFVLPSISLSIRPSVPSTLHRAVHPSLPPFIHPSIYRGSFSVKSGTKYLKKQTNIMKKGDPFFEMKLKLYELNQEIETPCFYISHLTCKYNIITTQFSIYKNTTVHISMSIYYSLFFPCFSYFMIIPTKALDAWLKI